MQKNDIINLKIDSLSIDGKGIGRHNDMVVFVPHSAIGDYLEVKILKVQKNYSFAKIQKILNSSPTRIDIDCNSYPKCGGCVFRHINYESELKIKENHVKECINRIAGIKNVHVSPIIGASNILRYRNKMQLPVQYDNLKNITTGFYRVHSHEIIPICDCKLNPTIFNEIVSDIKAWMKNYKICPYNEGRHSGMVRHIYIRQAEKTKEILICLVINHNNLPHQDKLIKSLKDKYSQIVGIIININKNKTNVILGNEYKTIFGKSFITDELCGVKLNISAGSFYQINHNQTEVLYNTVKNILNLDGSETVIDLYCGIGAIGLSLAKFASNIIGAEIVEEAINNAKINSKINNIKNTKFIYGDSSKIFMNLTNSGIKPDIVIVDPPRKGCDQLLIYNIAKINPKKVVYISCNPSTLARDLKYFYQHKFTLSLVIPVDMFPRTGHVETIAILTRKKS